MLELLTPSSAYYHMISDDPVRPHLPSAWRSSHGKQVYALFEDQYAQYAPVEDEPPRAIICVAYTNGVAVTEQDLDRNENANTAMFYTVWSYDRGAGREIVLATAQHIQDTRSDISRFVTLSPLTEMAERFHIRNGATLLQRGTECQNFEYVLDSRTAEPRQKAVQR